MSTMHDQPAAAYDARSNQDDWGGGQRLEEINRVLNEVALFTIFNTAKPSQPNTPVTLPGNRNLLVGMNVNEDLHRTQIIASTGGNGFRVNDRVGEQVAGIHMEWRVIPDDFIAHPNVM